MENDLKLYVFHPCERGYGNYVVMSDSFESAIEAVKENNSTVELTEDSIQIDGEEYS